MTATSPYIFMLILLIRNCLLEGSREGIIYYVRPNFEKMGEMQVSFSMDIYLSNVFLTEHKRAYTILPRSSRHNYLLLEHMLNCLSSCYNYYIVIFSPFCIFKVQYFSSESVPKKLIFLFLNQNIC